MFSPRDVQEFRFVAYAFDATTGLAEFTYAFDESLTFVETFRFPVPKTWNEASEERRAAFDRALFMLSLVAGISYYKAAVPSVARIESGATTPEERRILQTIYEKGLGEFAYVNQLDVRGRPAFEGASIDDRWLEPLESSRRRALVPVGGGKDSCVSIELLRLAGHEITLASINNARPIVEVMKESGLASLQVDRSLSPELFRINGEGALNGHVPVTAVVSLTLVALAILHDFDSVVMSNERSASTGNVEWMGHLVNHQWSKSLEAELALANLVHSSISPSIKYFSMLRPLSEVGIAKLFAESGRYFDVFTSCNRAFRIDESRRIDRWCAECPKCQFVFLALAPFFEPVRLAGIFGKDLLREMEQSEGFDALIGWNAHKPFECVGEVEESIAAFLLLTRDPRWRDHELVRRFETEILPQLTLPGDVVQRVLTPSTRHHIPDSFHDVKDKLFDAHS